MEKNQNGAGPSNSRNIALALIVTAVFLFFLVQSTFKEEAKKPSASKPVIRNVKDSDKLVTDLMQETNRKIEAQKKLGEIAVGFRVPHVGQLVPIKQGDKRPLELENPQPDSPTAMNYRPPDVSTDDTSPRAEIEHQLNDKQRLAEYDLEYRQRYIQAFVENARRNGWNIKVDKNGVVTSATPVPGFDSDENKAGPLNIFIPSAHDQH